MWHSAIVWIFLFGITALKSWLFMYLYDGAVMHGSDLNFYFFLFKYQTSSESLNYECCACYLEVVIPHTWIQLTRFRHDTKWEVILVVRHLTIADLHVSSSNCNCIFASTSNSSLPSYLCLSSQKELGTEECL